MENPEPITLRYFDCRGRAQAFRYYLNYLGIPYEDERVPVNDGFAHWSRLKSTPEKAGLFQRLPVLDIAGMAVSETQALAYYIHHSFGHGKALSLETNLKHAMLISSVDQDITVATGLVIWCEFAFPGACQTKVTQNALERLNTHLQNLDKWTESWNASKKNSDHIHLSDFFLFEGLDICQFVYGNHFHIENYPSLNKFKTLMTKVPEVAKAVSDVPDRFTGRPGEAEFLENMRNTMEQVQSN